MNKIDLNDTSYITLSTLPSELSNKLRNNFNTLFSYRPEKRGVVVMQNGDVKCDRWFQSYLCTPKFDSELKHSYMFSGKNPDPQPTLPLEFKEILDYINSVNEIKYNQVVVNWYKDKDDYIPFHSDYEFEKIPNSGVIIVNLTLNDLTLRNFVLKPKKQKGEIVKIPLPHGQIIEMHGETQKTHTHGVPKSPFEVAPRISLTFRAFKNE